MKYSFVSLLYASMKHQYKRPLSCCQTVMVDKVRDIVLLEPVGQLVSTQFRYMITFALKKFCFKIESVKKVKCCTHQ